MTRDQLSNRMGRELVLDAECWLWPGQVDRYGFGVARRDRRRVQAHRLAWTLARGPIPPKTVVAQRCDNKACCRPGHLRLAPVRAGAAAANARKRRCRAGHRYDRANTHVLPNGSRRCRACQRERWRAKGSDRRRATRSKAAK